MDILNKGALCVREKDASQNSLVARPHSRLQKGGVVGIPRLHTALAFNGRNVNAKLWPWSCAISVSSYVVAWY